MAGLPPEFPVNASSHLVAGGALIAARHCWVCDHCTTELCCLLLARVMGLQCPSAVGLSSPISWDCAFSASPWLILLHLFKLILTLLCHLCPTKQNLNFWLLNKHAVVLKHLFAFHFIGGWNAKANTSISVFSKIFLLNKCSLTSCNLSLWRVSFITPQKWNHELRSISLLWRSNETTYRLLQNYPSSTVKTGESHSLFIIPMSLETNKHTPWPWTLKNIWSTTFLSLSLSRWLVLPERWRGEIKWPTYFFHNPLWYYHLMRIRYQMPLTQ